LFFVFVAAIDMEQSNDVPTMPYKTASSVSAERALKYKGADEISNIDAQQHQSQLQPQMSSYKHGVISDNTEKSTTNLLIIDENLRAQLTQNGLHLLEFLGSGYFGTVFKAIYKKGEFDITMINSICVVTVCSFFFSFKFHGSLPTDTLQ
jgi:hypothetical protein